MLAVIFLTEPSSSFWIIRTLGELVNTFLMLCPPKAVGQWPGQSSLSEEEGRDCHWGGAERPVFLLWGGVGWRPWYPSGMLWRWRVSGVQGLDVSI